MCEKEGRKEEQLDYLLISRPDSRSIFPAQIQQDALSPSLSLSALLVCPVKEAVGEGHWQVISIPAGSAYSGVGSRIISF